MKTVLRRLKYYGIGFGIGLIMVIFFFQNRGCSWLPSNRVKNAILDRLIVVSDETNDILKRKGITTKDLIAVLNDGDIDYSASDKSGDSKIYVIEKNDVHYAFTLPYESFISEVFIDVKNKQLKYSKTGFGEILHYPADENIIHPDSSSIVTCQQEALGLIEPKKILKSIKASGKVDFTKSHLDQRPKPEHYIVFKHNDDMIGAKIIWYKNKLNIISFESDMVKDCE